MKVCSKSYLFILLTNLFCVCKVLSYPVNTSDFKDFFFTNPIVTSTSSVCLNATQPVVTFTASTTNLPVNFEYTINDGISKIVIAITNSTTINVPTSVAGTFVYKLLSYTDSSGTVIPVNESVTVTVKV